MVSLNEAVNYEPRISPNLVQCLVFATNVVYIRRPLNLLGGKMGL